MHMRQAVNLSFFSVTGASFFFLSLLTTELNASQMPSKYTNKMFLQLERKRNRLDFVVQREIQLMNKMLRYNTKQKIIVTT